MQRRSLSLWTLVALALFATPIYCKDVSLSIQTPQSPPTWALLQRQLLKANAEACQEFFVKYFDEKGFLLCVERWGGDDGPDDAGLFSMRWGPRTTAWQCIDMRGKGICANTRSPKRATFPLLAMACTTRNFQ